ncbi:MAG: type II secretion system F family protein, partial [Deltaproteobacteria bacterium]|nr:type II secretion system F family protein [Deltaproteobacteria bacterium]
MPKFYYKAIDENGNTRTGEVESDSLETATGILIERGFIPSKITEEARALGRFSWSAMEARLGSVKTPDLILFSKQFRTMIRAGVPILPLLQVLGNQTENPALRRVIAAISQSIQRGATLHDAFIRHPRVFSPLYCSLLKAGESSGALAEVMDRLIFIIEHEHRIKSDIKAALQYPIVVVIFLAVAFFVLLTVVIPKFARIFSRSGMDLPLPTRICMSLYQFLSNYWYLVLGAAIIGIVGLIL